MELAVEKIRLDGGTQPRAELLVDVMEDYAEQMRLGAKFPPVVVFFDGQDYWLADGFHRVGAAHRLRLPTIEAEVVQGSQSAAQWYSYGVNKSHGLRRNSQDKERAVCAALEHPKAAGLSNGQIAEHCGVSEATVRRQRKKLETHQTAVSSDPASTSTVSKSSEAAGGPAIASGVRERRRKGRDGRIINTANIGSARRRRGRKPRSAREFFAAWQEGYTGHPSSEVRLVLPNNHVRNCAYDLLEHFTFEYLQKVFQEIVNLHQERLAEEAMK